MTLKVSGPIFILSTKSESAWLIYLENKIKVVRDSYGLSSSYDTVIHIYHLYVEHESVRQTSRELN